MIGLLKAQELDAAASSQGAASLPSLWRQDLTPSTRRRDRRRQWRLDLRCPFTAPPPRRSSSPCSAATCASRRARWRPSRWEGQGPHAQHSVQERLPKVLCQPNVSRRFSANQVLRHSWIVSRGGSAAVG